MVPATHFEWNPSQTPFPPKGNIPLGIRKRNKGFPPREALLLA